MPTIAPKSKPVTAEKGVEIYVFSSKRTVKVPIALGASLVKAEKAEYSKGVPRQKAK